MLDSTDGLRRFGCDIDATTAGIPLFPRRVSLQTNCPIPDSRLAIVPGRPTGAPMRSLAAITIAFLSTTGLAGAAEVLSVRDAILQAVTSNPGVGEAATNIWPHSREP